MRLRVLLFLVFLLPLSFAGQQTAQQPSTTSRQVPLRSTSIGPSTGRHYTNVNGHRVHSPMAAPSALVEATAKCNDGTYSFSQHARGTCSHHGGVSTWLIH
jgi:Protein of unknown function (DUF3761)